jgi:hypothetical protein
LASRVSTCPSSLSSVYTSILSSAMVSPLRLEFLGGKTWLSLNRSYGTQRKRQCEPVGCGMVGECYQKRKEGADPIFREVGVWTGGLSPRPPRVMEMKNGKKTLAAIPKRSTRERTSLNLWGI